MEKRVLFLCTGNYYRSRFAEILFNALAAGAALPWRADSRGLATELGSRNVGPISVYALQELESRGVAVDAPLRLPLQACDHDMSGADLIVALKEEEHRPYLATRFPEWEARVEYWHIDDLDKLPAFEALAAIEHEVKSLIARLAAQA